MFNPLENITKLICAVFILSCGLLALYKNKLSLTNRLFFYLCASTFTWLFFYSINNPDVNNLYFFKIGYCGITFIPVFLAHFMSRFLSLPYSRKLVPLAYVFGLTSCDLIIFTNLIVSGIRTYRWGIYPQAGSLHFFYLLIFFVLLIIAIFSLFTDLNKNKREVNNNISLQKKYVLFSFIIFSLSSFDFLPNHGIDYYPLGHIPAAVYIVIIAYTMIKHHLLDINVVIKKSIIYSLLLILISIVFIAAVFLIERFTQMVIGYNTIILSLTFAVLIALLLSPLKLVIQNFVDKIIFKATPAELSSKNELLLERISQSEKLKTAATFASGIAHEIKNPLTAIKTFSEFLPSKKDDHDFLDRFSKIVGKEVARIDDLVNQLLEYAKPAPLILKNINILKLISETLDFLSSEFIKHQIRVERNWSQATSILIKIDSNKFRQAYLNIFLNAIDAMPQGGTLKISAEILKASSSRLMIKIQDTGCGIKPKDLPHIFEPFFSKKDKGTGLGLAITQKIIMDHGGDIIVESQEGKGSLFEISLPLESGPGTEGD